MKPKILYLMCGPSGAGKSTWVEKKLENENGIWCSRDVVRFHLLNDSDDYFAHEDEVFETWIAQIKRALRTPGANVYVDATHLSEKARNKVLSRLDLTSVSVIPVSFKPSLETCLKQNSYREGRARVPENVIKDMYNKYKAPTMNEKYEYEAIIEVGETNV